MNIPASSEQQAWLLAKLPSHEEWQVWRCARRRGGVSWALYARCSAQSDAEEHGRAINASGEFACIIRVTINPDGNQQP